MEIVTRTDYSEEMPLHELSPMQYVAVTQQAIARLHWQLVHKNESTIYCRTLPSGYYSEGELISITVNSQIAVFTSKPFNEYFHDPTQHKKNATLFREAILKDLQEREIAERNLHPMHREKYGALVPSKSYKITPAIVYLNMLVYIAMVIAGVSPLNPTARELWQWGGNLGPALAGGEWWRLLTYMFLHGGAMHLLMNTFALLYIGMFLEPLLGRQYFATAYVFTGICAGLVSIAMHPMVVSVGASGAIFGMYGVFLALLTTNLLQKTHRKTMLRSILFFVVLNLLYGLQGNTDNAAHVGGLLSGIVIGRIYYPGVAAKTTTNRKWKVISIVAGAIVATAGVVIYCLGHFATLHP